MTNKKNPARDIARSARSVMMGAHVILALGTACVGWMLVQNWQWLAEILPPFYHNLAAIAGGLGMYYLLDQKALVHLPYAVNVVLQWMGMNPGEMVKLNQKSKFMRFFDILAVAVAFIMISGSAYMNFVVTPDLGGMVTGTADTSTEQRAMSENNTVFLSGQKGLESSVERAQSAVTDAEQKAQKLIEAAQKSKGAELARLANGGNDWARKQIAGAVASATRKGERGIEKAKRDLAKAQGKLDAYVEKQGGKVIAGNEKLTGLITTTLTSHNTRLNNYTGVLWYVMLGSLLLFIGCCVMVEIYESETGDQVKPAATIGKVFGAAQEKAGQGMLSGLARALGVRDRVEFRVNGNGTIAATLPRTAERRTNSLGATLSPEQIREREHWSRDRERQEERRRETAGQNTDRDWESESQKVRKSEQNNTETTQTQHRYENKPETGDGVGVMPSRNDRTEWDNFVKRWRQWCDYYTKSSDPSTRSINRERILKGIEHIREQGGIALWDEGTGQRSVKMPIRSRERMETRPLIEYGIDGQEIKPGEKAYSGTYDFALDGDDDNLLFEAGRKIEQ